ncbi:hypothetical protein WA158_006901 [Blastocystis sp. Blastoise]
MFKTIDDSERQQLLNNIQNASKNHWEFCDKSFLPKGTLILISSVNSHEITTRRHIAEISKWFKQYSPSLINYTYDDLKSLKVANLKDICKTHGLSVYGKKECLIKSIMSYTEFISNQSTNVPLLNLLKGYSDYNRNTMNSTYRSNFNWVDLLNSITHSESFSFFKIGLAKELINKNVEN